MHHFGQHQLARCFRKNYTPQSSPDSTVFCTAAQSRVPSGNPPGLHLRSRYRGPGRRCSRLPALLPLTPRPPLSGHRQPPGTDADCGSPSVHVGAPEGANRTPKTRRSARRATRRCPHRSLNGSPPPRTAGDAPSSRNGRSCRRCSRRWRVPCPHAPSPDTAAAGCGGRP